jgi:hypothetical protein
VQKACGQWTGSRCGIIDEVLAESGASVKPDDGAPVEVPPCAIRATCRWFAQVGAAACGVCPEVVTDKR